MKLRRSTSVLFVLCAMLFLCVACTRQAPSSRDAVNRAPSSVLRIVTSYKIQSLDPTRAGSYFLIEYGAAELPLMLDDDFNLKPNLIESYAQVDDTNWRLTLRPNVKFQNGKLLTSQALAACMNRQLEQSPSAKGVLPEARITVMNEREVMLTTARPNPNVPAALADELVFPIYDVEAVEAARRDARKLIDSGCYTGAYKIVSLDEREMLMTANANYWQGTPPLESVSVRFVADVQARLLAVQAGEADIALYPPTEAKRMLANNQDAFFVTSDNSNGGPRIFFNLRRAPFDDLAARQAFSLAIDYESLAQEVMDGVFDTATGFYPPKFAWAINNQRTDVDEARRILDAAGWRMGADSVRVRGDIPLEAIFLVYPQQPDWTTLVTAIQAQLKEIGFRITIRQVDSIEAAMKNPTNWNIALRSPGIVTTGGAPDPLLHEYLTTTGENNFGGINDSELNKLIDELGQTFDSSRRHELLARIQQIVIAERAYEVRPVFSRSRVVVGRRFRDYQPSPQLHYITYATRLAN